jgi:predicted phage-related endonuclease
MIRIPKPPHGSIDWLLVRHRDENGNVTFGASEAGALMGVSEYSSLADLCVAKLSEPEETPPTKAMLKGVIFEDALIGNAAKELGLPFTTPTEMFRKDRFTATLDGATDDLATVVECKVTSAYTISDASDLPLSWVMQGHVQHFVTGADIWFSVFDRRQNLVVVQMPINENVIEELMLQSERVGHSLDRGMIPDPAWADMTADLVQKVYQPVAGKTVEADEELVNWIVDLENTKRMIKELQGDEDRAKDAIAKRMLDAETVTSADGSVLLSWKAQKGRTSFDAKSFEQDHPELFGQYKREGAPFRVMRFGKAK